VRAWAPRGEWAVSTRAQQYHALAVGACCRCSASRPQMRSAVDAEAVCGATTLTTLSFFGGTSLNVVSCDALMDKEVQALSSLTGLTGPQPPQLHQREERGAARSEQPHIITHHPQP
jgi:hypothetical protein